MSERFIVDDAGTLIDMVTRNTYDYVSEVCPLLNDIDSENTHVKYLLSEHMVDLNNCKGKCSTLEEENEQLKKRNNNQYNQLTELWQIIEEENWEKLIAMKKQLKEDEERLRNEWKCYE